MARVSVPFTEEGKKEKEESGGFYSWLISQGRRKRTARDTVYYAKRYASVLDTGDASIILNTVKPLSLQHVLSALANLSKYQGRYEWFCQIRRNYNLHWVKTDPLNHFQRFFDEELTLDIMLQRIRQMVRLLPPFMAQIIKFGCLVGLRAAEVIECVKLLNDKQAYSKKYYNSNRQALEHFRFPEVFIRQTKKAYISFVTPEIIKDIQMLHNNNNVPSRVAIMKACQRRKIKTDFHLTRKIFASWLRKEGIQPEVVDMLSGRVSQSVLVRHYLVPQSTLKDDVLRAITKLQKEIENC